MLINLITNSITHAFIDDQAGEINIKIKHGDSSLSIEYSDNGVGISDEKLPNIFDKYFTTKADDGGSGLGLYFVKSIVEDQLNGSLTCTSVLSMGTRFKITFPVEII